MKRAHEPGGEDLLKVRDLVEEYHLSQASATSLMRALGREGRTVYNSKIRGVWVRRRDVEASFQSSGGTTCA